jgi:hypothetical protein
MADDIQIELEGREDRKGGEKGIGPIHQHRKKSCVPFYVNRGLEQYHFRGENDPPCWVSPTRTEKRNPYLRHARVARHGRESGTV